MAFRNEILKCDFFVVKASVEQRDGGCLCCCLYRGRVEVVFFSDWLPFLSAVCVKHGEEKKKKNKTHNTHRRVATLSQSQLCVCGGLANWKEERA